MSKVKRHGRSAALEWYGTPCVVPYIYLDRCEFLMQDRDVLFVIETFRDEVTVFPFDRYNPQEGYDAVADDARIHYTRIDVQRIETLR